MGKKKSKSWPAIEVDWLGQSVVIMRSFDEVAEAFPGAASKCDGIAGAGWCTHEETGQAMFWLVFPEEPDVATLAHECCHIVDYLFDYTGIPISVDNTETRAYMVGWLCEKVLERMKWTL